MNIPSVIQILKLCTNLQAKDKEQAVFHLYRIYDLHPVKHENLRPEKLQKSPSAIEGEADEDDAQSGGIAGVDGTPSPTKRLRKAKSRKAKQEGDTLWYFPVLISC